MAKEITFTYKFNIFSENIYDVNAITEVLGIEPSEKWIKGDLIRLGLLREQSCWSLISEEIISYTFQESFLDFFNNLNIPSSKLHDLIRMDNLQIQVDSIIKIYQGHTMPGIHLGNELLQIFSDIRCSVDFDIYDFRT